MVGNWVGWGFVGDNVGAWDGTWVGLRVTVGAWEGETDGCDVVGDWDLVGAALGNAVGTLEMLGGNEAEDGDPDGDSDSGTPSAPLEMGAEKRDGLDDGAEVGTDVGRVDGDVDEDKLGDPEGAATDGDRDGLGLLEGAPDGFIGVVRIVGTGLLVGIADGSDVEGTRVGWLVVGKLVG